MERFNDELVLTTSQVGELLSVHPSTVKRWCDQGELASDKTEGGHRRIHLQDVLETAAERGIDTYLDRFAPYQPHVWSAVTEAETGGTFRKAHSVAMGWLVRGHLDRVGWLFRELGRRPAIPFPLFCDDGVRGFMKSVGDAWREGRLRVGEEHLASQMLVEALLHLRGEAHLSEEGRAGGPASGGEWIGQSASGGGRPGRYAGTAIVGSAEGDQHHIGSLCVRLLLERRGWTVLYLGPDVPVEDFACLQRSRNAELVCISFSDPVSGADVGRCVRMLGELGSPGRPYSLALGGLVDRDQLPAAGRTHFGDLECFSTIRKFGDALDAGFATRRVLEGVAS